MKFPYSLLVPCGTFLLLSAPLFAETAPPVLITMASENTDAKSQVQHGLRDYLMGWNEMAAVHFRAAVEADDNAALAWCGLMLSEGHSSGSHELGNLLSSEVFITPQEDAFISSALRWLGGDRSGAGEEFVGRAEQYRNDTLSTCFAIMLLHDRYEEIGDRPRAEQGRALELAQQLYGRQPQNPLVAYLRGWVEETAPQPSDEALSAAQHSTQMLPEHPAPRLLYGHLLYRKGRLREAISELHLASELAEKARRNVPCGTNKQAETASYPLEKSTLELRAKLYESTLLWLDGQNRASLLLQSQLLQGAARIDKKFHMESGAILLKWEGRTLPLRLLMLQPKLPSEAQIAAATKAAMPELAEKGEPLLEVRDCLRFCLVARVRAAAGKGAQAQRCIQSAEACFRRLAESRQKCAEQGAYTLSAWTRAHEACQLALLAAKAAAYPDTSDIWLNSLKHAKRTSSMLMPPVLPQQNN